MAPKLKSTGNDPQLDFVIGYLRNELRLAFHSAQPFIQDAILHLFELAGSDLDEALRYLHVDCGATPLPLAGA